MDGDSRLVSFCCSHIRVLPDGSCIVAVVCTTPNTGSPGSYGQGI